MSTILVADDMAVFREPIAASLRQAGYETLCAQDGSEAMTMIEKDKPDLILLDVAMPKMDGLTFLERIRIQPRFRDLPVVLLTASSDRDHIIRAGKLGVRDYLLKTGFSLLEMLQRVEKYLGHGEYAENAVEPQTPTKEIAAPEQPNLAHDGKPPADLLKSIRPVVKRSEMMQLLEDCGELKALSPTVAQVMKMTSTSRCSIEQLARAIKNDQAIALKILKLANSVVYTRGEPVESVQKAVMRIGITQIRQAVMNIEVIERFGSASSTEYVNTPMFWEHSIAVGLIAAELTHARNGTTEAADSAFTRGLLHDVGRMVYTDLLGERYEQVLKTAAQLQLPLERVESRMLLVNHADAMDRVLHAWRFPKNLINPIALHHLSMGNIRQMARSTSTEVATLALADRLAHALLLGSSGNDTIYPIEEFMQSLKLSGNVMGRIEEFIPDQTQDVKFAMLATFTQTAWPEKRAEVREQIGIPLRPLFVSDDPTIDAYRIFCDQITEPSEDDPPNIAIVHVNHKREVSRLSTRLREREQEHEIDPLPIVIISASGDMQLEEGVMKNRRPELLASPTPIARFAEAVQKVMAEEN